MIFWISPGCEAQRAHNLSCQDPNFLNFGRLSAWAMRTHHPTPPRRSFALALILSCLVSTFTLSSPHDPARAMLRLRGGQKKASKKEGRDSGMIVGLAKSGTARCRPCGDRIALKTVHSLPRILNLDQIPRIVGHYPLRPACGLDGVSATLDVSFHRCPRCSISNLEIMKSQRGSIPPLAPG